MIINRELLINELFAFSQGGNGIVIGKPGIGKSYALAQLSDILWEKDIPNFIIKVDETDGTNEAIQNLLQVNDDWVKALNSLEINGIDDKAVLIIDSFDSARDEDLRQKYLKLIRKALCELSDRWSTVVSVRTYDATKSPELLKLFSNHTYSANVFDRCRSMEIKNLEKRELESVLEENSFLKLQYHETSPKLKDLLTIPFFLKIFEVIVKQSGSRPSLVSQIKSESELLDWYWSVRIENSFNSYNKNAILKSLAFDLMKCKSLSIDKAQYTTDSETFISLSSDDIISEVGLGGRNVAFSHNILFDYAISKYVIPVETDLFINFLKDDKSRAFFLRPSLAYQFSDLWNRDRLRFWERFDTLSKVNDSHLKLFNSFLPQVIIASEFQTLEDIKPILGNLKSLKQFLQALRFLGATVERRLIDLLVHLSQNINPEWLSDYAFITENFLNDTVDTKIFNEELGVISRNFLKYTLDKRSQDPSKLSYWDQLASMRGIQMVSKTYLSDKNESRNLLSRVLELLHEPNFNIWYFSNLTEDVKYFLEHDSEFVAEVYKKIFSYEEVSTQATSMGKSVIMNFVSNRKQDFELCQYRLIQQFPNFIEASPAIAVSIGVQITNSYIRKYKTGNLSAAETTVKIGKRNCSIVSDLSSIWHDSIVESKPLQFAPLILTYFEQLLSENQQAKLTELLYVYTTVSRAAFMWKKLFEFLSNHPLLFKRLVFDIVYELEFAKIPDTTYEIGVLISKTYDSFTIKQKLQLERKILTLNDDSHSRLSKRLLSCIKKERLRTKEGINLLIESNTIKNEPLFQSSWSSETYTTDKWLQDKGVDLNDPLNSKIYSLLNDLESINRQPSNEELGVESGSENLVLEKAFNLENLITTNKSNLKDELICSAYVEIYKLLTKVLVTSTFEKHLFGKIKGSIINGITNYTLFDLEFNKDSSPATGYSSTPRIEAASGLMKLFAVENDDSVFLLLKEYLEDENPIVRFNLSKDLRLVYNKRRDEFWKLINHRITHEPDNFIRSSVIRSFYSYSIIEGNVNDVEHALEISIDKIDGSDASNSFIDVVVSLLLELLFRYDNKNAEALLYKCVGRMGLERAIISKVFELTNPTKGFYFDEAIGSNISKVIYLIHQQLFFKLNKAGIEENNESVHKYLELLDFTVQRIYFVLIYNADHITQSDVIEQKKKFFYIEWKFLFLEIIEQSKQSHHGIIAAHTAHYIVQTLNGVLKFYPEQAEEILSMVLQLSLLSRADGYTFDTVSIREIVNLTETLIVEHKSLLSKTDSLENLVTLLNIYVDSGWTDALKLLWKLDEAFK